MYLAIGAIDCMTRVDVESHHCFTVNPIMQGPFAPKSTPTNRSNTVLGDGSASVSFAASNFGNAK